MDYPEFKRDIEAILRERYETLKGVPVCYPLTHVMDEAHCTSGSWFHEKLLEADEAIWEQAKERGEGE